MEAKIQTFSGGVVYFLEPAKSEFTIEDIAHGLSNTCRYGGQCKFFYSVAQHSLMMSYMVPDAHKLQALHHDDTEAFMCDVPTPLKMALEEYIRVEKGLHDVIFDWLLLPRELSAEVKEVDICALGLEKPILMPHTSIEWKIPKLDHESWDEFRAYIKPMRNEDVKQLWLDRHMELINNQMSKTKR